MKLVFKEKLTFIKMVEVFFRLFRHCKARADDVLKKKQQEIILIF